MHKTKISLTTLAFLLATSAFSLAEYEIKLDTTDKKVYIVSGDTQISIENATDYFSGTVSNPEPTPGSGNNTASGSNESNTSAPVFSGSLLTELEN
ncbi:hypothetical protein FACS1894176_02550 [Bacteroidia bacterium]|nr:hypothetical protein FACS1894176_02550 [Bacteroidia bacterium]